MNIRESLNVKLNRTYYAVVHIDTRQSVSLSIEMKQIRSIFFYAACGGGLFFLLCAEEMVYIYALLFSAVFHFKMLRIVAIIVLGMHL